MPSNPTNEPPTTPGKLPQGTRGPKIGAGTGGPKPVTGHQLTRTPLPGRPTSSYSKDQPPGMGGAAPGQQGDYVQQQRNFAPQQPPVQVGSLNVKAYGGIGLGLLLIVGGAGATWISYDSAKDGGSYTIWWGPVVFGVVVFFGGIAALFKK